MARMVNCVKFGKELPGLAEPPVTGELGQRIYENVSQQGWDLWKEQRVILVNHYGLTMYDPNAQKFLREQLEEFFFGEGAEIVPEELGAPTQGGKSQGKAPSPQRK